MPIKSENRDRYPFNWKQISEHIRFDRAGNRCETCGAANYKPHPETGKKVILTVHHIDFHPENNDEGNLIALCQRCHNRADAAHRTETRKKGKGGDSMPIHSQAELDDVFTYHAPTPEQLPKYEAIRAAGKAFAQVIYDNTPASGDQQVALRKIREAVMVANAAVALNGKC